MVGISAAIRSRPRRLLPLALGDQEADADDLGDLLMVPADVPAVMLASGSLQDRDAIRMIMEDGALHKAPWSSAGR